MEKFTAFMEKHILPVAAKVGNQRHLIAVRDGFVLTIAIIIAGSFAVLMNNLPIPAYQSLMTTVFGEAWKGFGGTVWWATFAVNSVFVVMTVAYSLSKSYGDEGIGAAVISLASFFAFVPQSIKVAMETGVVKADGTALTEVGAWGNLNWTFLSQNALLTAILVAIVATEIFTKLSKSDKLTIKMPEGVPPAVARSFAKLLPGLITLSVMSLLSHLLTLYPIMEMTSLNEIINKLVAAPLQSVSDTFGAALIVPFLVQFFWFFGLHGPNIMLPFTSVAFGPLLEKNMVWLQNGSVGPAPHVLTGPFFDAFVYLGGSGATLGLLIAIFLASKSKQHKLISELGFAPGLFQINEPVIFGMPLVLNPIFAVPFILVTPLLSGISFLAIQSGLVAPVVAAMPWTTPAIIGGYLATGGHISGAILAAVNLVISIVIYLPFVAMSSKANVALGEE